MKRRVSHIRRLVRDPLVRRIGVAAALAVLLVLFRASIGVRSAPLTDGATERVSITNGVLTIAPGGPSDNVMELGNRGNEIVSTGPIFIMPGGTQAGTRFIGNSDQTQDLSMTGSVTITGRVVLGDPAEPSNWRTTWPEPDGWTRTVEPSKAYLTPNERTSSIDTGTQPSQSEAYGFGVYANDPAYSGLNVSNYMADSDAIDFNAHNLEIRGNLNIFPGSLYAYVGGQSARVWTTDNDGNGSGLSADKLDGLDTYVAPCGSGKLCLCAVTTDAPQNHCQELVAEDYNEWFR